MPTPPPVYTSIATHIYVANLPAALAFYTERLGFGIDFTYGEPAFYAQVRRDNAVLALRAVPEAVFAGDVRERESLVSASITLASRRELEEIFADFSRAEVAFHQRLEAQPWGAVNFIVRDPDGNLLLFAAPSE